MKRDMDLVRSILIEIEEGKKNFDTMSSDIAEMKGYGPDGRPTREIAEQLLHHLTIMEQRGLIAVGTKSTGGWHLLSLTWEGHEFLGTIRDGEIWQQTKELAKKGGVATLEAVWRIATEVAKGYVKQRTGLEI